MTYSDLSVSRTSDTDVHRNTETVEAAIQSERNIQTRLVSIESLQQENRNHITDIDHFIKHKKQRNIKIIVTCAVATITVVAIRLLFSAFEG